METELERYGREVCKQPLLTTEEEAEFACRYAQVRDPVAARRLISSHLRLVVAMVRECAGRDAPIDLVQEGSIGLMNALNKFDHARGRFASYATIFIRSAIFKYMLDNFMPLDLSASRRDRELFFELVRAREGGCSVSVEQIAQAIQAPTEFLSLLSAERASNADPDSTDGMESATKAIAQIQIQGRLRALVGLFEGKLTATEREIFRARWLTEKPSPLRELGSRHRLHFLKVHRIDVDILRRLRKFVEHELDGALAA